MKLLPQINGVFFSGGSLTWLERDLGQKYLRTAKKIYQYSKMLKDQRGEEWPILGTSKGLEIISSIICEESI